MQLDRLPERIGYQLNLMSTIALGVDRQAEELERSVSVSQPKDSELGVCFFAPMPDRFARGAKVSAPQFLPPFCGHLRQQGIRTSFATSHRALKKAVRQVNRAVVVCIYREELNTPASDKTMRLLNEASIVFNHPITGNIIRDKGLTNVQLAAAGCPVPRSARDIDLGSPVFSNAISDSGSEAFVTTAEADANRHNTEFVDTRLTFGGAEYFTTVRLMCINNRITHQFLRARLTSEGNPSVHAKDTPIDVDIINALHREVCSRAGDQFQHIANCVYEAFGPGFYSHDVLVDTRTNQAFICETGFKFNDMTYQGRMRDIARNIDGLAGYEDPAKAGLASARAFAELIR